MNIDEQYLGTIVIISHANRLTTDKSHYTPIPGAIIEYGDLPGAVGFLETGSFRPGNSLPLGSFSIGPVVLPDTPCSDLELQYYDNWSTQPVNFGNVVCVPEATTRGMAALALMGLAVLRACHFDCRN